MPICAPVGGRPGPAMNGHRTGVCSLVIRHEAMGARAGLQPRSRTNRPRSGMAWNSRSLDPDRAVASVWGRVWPKSASRVGRLRPGFIGWPVG